MTIPEFIKNLAGRRRNPISSLQLQNGSRVAVIGGGNEVVGVEVIAAQIHAELDEVFQFIQVVPGDGGGDAHLHALLLQVVGLKFPPHQQDQVRAQLSFVLQGFVSQQLIPRATGGGRVLCLEVLVMTPAVRNLVREDKLHQVYSQMQVGQAKYGMQTMIQSLFALLQRRLITPKEAMALTTDLDELKTMLT